MADGSKKRYQHKERIRYYECYICRYKHNAAALEASFFETVGDLRSDDAVLRLWVEAPKAGTGEATALRRELATLERESSEGEEQKRLDRAFDVALAASMPPEQLRRQVERVKDEFAAKRLRAHGLREQLESRASTKRTLETARSLLGSFRSLYARAEYDEKREMVNATAQALGGLHVGVDGLVWPKRPGSRKSKKRKTAPGGKKQAVPFLTRRKTG